MAADDNETYRRLSDAEERALKRARAAAERGGNRGAGGPSRSARWLALVPVTVAVLMGALLMPRATEPDAIPLPLVDARALRETMRADDARARRVTETRLPTDALAVGSGVRELQAAQAAEAAEDKVVIARGKLDEALRGVVAREGWEDDLLALRAVQMRGFLDEVRRFEETGQPSKELDELGGAFVRRMEAAGWVERGRVVLDEAQRRAAFKTVWNALVSVEAVRAFALSVDETRALYTLYITRPHPPEAQRATLELLRKTATTEHACLKARADERRATEAWRAEKIRKLGGLDPAYPTQYALGVAYYRAGRHDLAIDAFRSFVDAHPDGPWALRARNHLRAAVAAYGPI